MREGLLAGLKYCAVIFALGFVLGVLRQTLLLPTVGALWATAIELPFMLGASWVWCGHLVRARGWQVKAMQRRVMGVSALAFLLLAELMLDQLIGARDLAAFFRAWATPAGFLGLAGQITFGLMPLWVARTSFEASR